ncbi:MAG: M48 family metalloprotease [Sphingosinicella sp.]
MRKAANLICLVVALLDPSAAAAVPDSAETENSLRAMRVLDQRVTSLGHRLAVANRDFCRQPSWRSGFMLHHIAQYGRDYRLAATRAFGLADAPAVLAVASGSAADRAGLRADDAVLRVDGQALPPPDSRSRGFAAVERMLDAVDQAFADGQARLELRRGTVPLTLDIAAERGCAGRFQLVPSRQRNAWADGRYVQLTTAVVQFAGGDDEVAAILAHEFAHNVLGHRDRLDQARVGILGGIRLERATEREADRLSVYLLERAGLNPEAAVRVWQRLSRGDLFGSLSHPGWRERIVLLRREILAIRQTRAAGQTPWPDFVPRPADTAFTQ